LRINHLLLENYRNYSNLELDIQPAGAIIFGKNGSGKTNLLEAIAYSAFGRSFQTIHDDDLIHFQRDFFRINSEFNLNDKNLNIDAAYSRNNKKIKINQHQIKKLSELFKYIKVVYFSPQDIEFSAGSPGFRRYFFDLAITQFSYQYMEVLKQYSRVLKQRNALLKHNFSREEKLTWDESYINLGVQIINMRKDYLRKFDPKLTEYYNFISNNNEVLTSEYLISFPMEKGKNIESCFEECLRKNEKKEIENQRSMYGPHLDDYYFRLNGRSFRKFGSQGQKRSLVISARLVQANLIFESAGDYPILMFDDILADLDTGRTSRILQLLKTDHQIFIATPNLKHYEITEFPKIDLEQL
jgi:DNA replication and repair protein RecF